MFSIDFKSDPQFYIIIKDCKEFCKISKSNDLNKIAHFFGVSYKIERGVEC